MDTDGHLLTVDEASLFAAQRTARPAGPWRPGGTQQIPRPAEHLVVEHAPWPQRRLAATDLTTAVTGHRGPAIGPAFPESRPSAVLVVIGDGAHGADVLLTKRSQSMRNHSGEISFPGGRLDPGETFEQAAVREAAEEVGLDGDAVELVGRLDPLNTLVSRSFIVPVVARLVAPRPPLRAVTDEVDSVFWVPFAELVRADTYREEQWGASRLSLHFFELDTETIWGATARILHQLLELAVDLPVAE